MRASLRVLFGVVIVAASLSFTTPANAQSQPWCTQAVTDQAGWFGENTKPVQDAAQQLTSQGADVHVIAIKSFGNAGNLTDYVKNTVLKACPGWTKGDLIRNSLLIYVVSTSERKLSIVAGDQWKGPLLDNGDDVRIRTEIMGPEAAKALDDSLSSGERSTHAAKTFTDGMNESSRLIRAYLHPSSSGSGGTVINNSKPTDLTGLWVVMGIIVGLIAFGAIIFFFVRTLGEQRRRRAGLADAKADLAATRQALGERIAELDDGDRQKILEAKYNQYGTASPELAAAFENMFKLRQQATSGLANLDGSGQLDTSNRMTVDSVQTLDRQFAGLLTKATDAVAQANTVERLASALQEQIRNFAQLLAAAKAEQEKVVTDLAALKEEGFKTDLDQLVAEDSQIKLDAVEPAGANPEGIRLLAVAKAAIAESREQVDTIPRRRDEIVTATTQLEADIADAKTNIQTAAESFGRISAEYAEFSWRSVRGNGTEAIKRLDLAVALHAEIKQLSSMETQDWSGAQHALDNANDFLTEAGSLTQAIITLESNLATARDEAANEIAAAESDIAKASGYLSEFDDDLRGILDGDLVQASVMLREAKDELAQPKPDYPKVVKLATGANHAADRIYDKALDVHETKERARQQAATALRQAQTSYDTARDYIDNHSLHVKQSAKDKLRDAKRSLDSAQASRNPADILKLSQQAKKLADKAMDMAEEDFDDWEESQRPSYDSYPSSSDDMLTGIAIGSSMPHDHGPWGSSSDSSFDSSFGSDSGFDSGGGSDSSFSDSFGGGGGGDSGF